jgi:hypothetical protein
VTGGVLNLVTEPAAAGAKVAWVVEKKTATKLAVTA